MGVSVFTDHLIAALGLSRVRLSTAYMAGTLMSALLMTKAGRLTDRFGVRAVSTAAAGSCFGAGIFTIAGSAALLLFGTAAFRKHRSQNNAAQG